MRVLTVGCLKGMERDLLGASGSAEARSTPEVPETRCTPEVLLRQCLFAITFVAKAAWFLRQKFGLQDQVEGAPIDLSLCKKKR